jgi:hypothetical protein
MGKLCGHQTQLQQLDETPRARKYVNIDIALLESCPEGDGNKWLNNYVPDVPRQFLRLHFQAR